MPALAVHRSAPSTLADVIRQVVDAFDAMGDATPILVGADYLEGLGTGSPPRILFVPEKRGKIGPPAALGMAASITHSCDVYVRAAESGGDVDRLQAAYELGDRVISCIATAATGRLEWGSFVDDSPSDVDGFGADLAFAFTYTRGVRHDAKRWTLPAATADSGGISPQPPPGLAGEVDSIDVTTAPVEPEEN